MDMIPKKIHYFWIGGAPKPESVQHCIDSWRKYCPDYEIIEWNESNYDFQKNKYMAQAFAAKKWGFVPDYGRLDVIYEHGGIYLDTDVEIIRSFDPLLSQEAFIGFEESGEDTYNVNCGQGFGAVPHHEVVRQMRDYYDDLSFLQEDGSLNMTPSPQYTTQVLLSFGLIQKNTQQELPRLTVYPTDVLCPKNFKTGKICITSNTYSIHHFDSSWWSDEKKYAAKLTLKFSRFLPHQLSRRTAKAISGIRYRGVQGVFADFKKFISK